MREKLLALLVPPFLRKLDRWLLLNHPRWWATKVHYVVFYGLLANLFASLFVFLIPLRFNQLRDLNSEIMTISLYVEIAVFILWLSTQSLFSLEREYGDINDMAGWMESILSAVCVLLIFSPAISMLITGIYKTASMLEIRGQNICEGPILLEFYSDSDLYAMSTNKTWKFDIDNFKKALNLGGEATLTKQVKQVIGIEYDVFTHEEKISSFGAGDQMGLDNENETLHVENGEATIKIFADEEQKIEIIVKHIGSIVITHNGDIIKTTAGDEIILKRNNGSGGVRFAILNGEISANHLYLTTIPENEAVIVKDGGEIKLAMGGEIVQTSSEIQEYRIIGNYSGQGAYEACQGIKYFVSDINIYLSTDTFRFSQFALTNMILIMLCIFFVMILRHSNWRILFFSFLYLVAWYIPPSIINGLMQIIDIYLIGTSYIFMIFVIAFVIFASIQSILLIGTNRYKDFSFINFVSLPIAIGYYRLILSYQISVPEAQYTQTTSIFFIFDSDLHTIQSLIFSLAIFFLFYLFFAPILKKILTYLRSLPRD